MTQSAVTRSVRAALEEAQRRGFVGPGPVASHVTHAWPLVAALPPDGIVIDLGSGGGVPALVLALACPGLEWVLVESQLRRSSWLREAVVMLGLDARVVVDEARVEETGRGPRRGTAAAVTARSFGPPAVTAECAAPLLRPGGICWVAEPPVPAPGRWPEDGLGVLGLALRPNGPHGWAGLELVAGCPDRYPRRVGIPTKRPLF